VQYCATCIAEMLHNTKHRDSSVNIPLSPDQHHCSDEAKWRIGNKKVEVRRQNREKRAKTAVMSTHC